MPKTNCPIYATKGIWNNTHSLVLTQDHSKANVVHSHMLWDPAGIPGCGEDGLKVEALWVKKETAFVAQENYDGIVMEGNDR